MEKIRAKHIIAMLLVLAAMAALCACNAQQADVPLASEAEIYEMQRLYRSSSLVVVAKCLRTHTDASGNVCCDVSVERTVAGTLEHLGKTLHCPLGSMKEGEEYLLYLAQGDDVYQSEDMDSFKIVGNTAFRIKNDVVYVSGSVIDMSSIETAISQAGSIISVQSESLYYKNIAALSEGSDYIFIGRVKEAPAIKPMAFRSHENGATIENELPASLLTVEVYGSVKGSLKYGSEIQVVYCPTMAEGMIDASTLKPAACDPAKLPVPVEGDTYLFFLSKGPDEKQDYYFGVNPLQLMAQLDDNDRVNVDGANRALSSFRSLDAVVRNIRKALNG